MKGVRDLRPRRCVRGIVVASTLCAWLLPAHVLAEKIADWKGFFQQSWSADACERTHQTWDDYWGFVGEFSDGNFFRGWFDRVDQLTGGIADPARRGVVRADLLALGRRVAAKWAKENSCRRIRCMSGPPNQNETGKPAVQDWGRMPESAAAADVGNGDRIELAAHAILAQLDAALRDRASEAHP